tara:strand:+ start:641 stop:916 length:276 start_codon:yes stop_codon:yes gene_type:complete
MQYRSTKISSANTTISDTGGLFYGILIVGATGVSTTNNIKIYDATSATNQIAEFAVSVGTTLQRSLNINCRTGIRVECAAWTNLEVYVLHC